MGKQADDTFNEPFQPNEILKAVKTLKNGKSAAGDLISNEMINYGFPVLIEPILILLILSLKKENSPNYGMKVISPSYIKRGKI
jgi:hypothetical protein